MERTHSEEVVARLLVSVIHTIQAKTLDTSPRSDGNSGGSIQLRSLGTHPYPPRVFYAFFINHMCRR